MILSIKDYLRKNPEATLADYDNYVDETNKAKRAAAQEHERNYSNWIESKIGCYFFIDHNGSYKTIFELGYRPNGSRSFRDLVAKKSYEYYKDSSTVKLTIEDNRTVNELWLPNPYQDKYRNSGCKAVYEISKEQFDEFVNIFNNLSKMHEDCENIYSKLK